MMMKAAQMGQYY